MFAPKNLYACEFFLKCLKTLIVTDDPGELTARDSTQQAMLDVITGPVCGGLEEQVEGKDNKCSNSSMGSETYRPLRIL